MKKKIILVFIIAILLVSVIPTNVMAVLSPPTSKLNIEKKRLSGYTGGDILALDGYYYYGGAKGVIYQTPIANLKMTKKVYQLPLWSYGDGKTYVLYSLTKNNDQAWLMYHQGGAAMGADHYIKLNKDGTYAEVESGYLTFKTFGDITVKVDQWGPPSRANLMIKYDGQEYRRVGDPAYLFAWTGEQADTSFGFTPSKDLYLIGHNLYILACNMKISTDTSRIYRVNIDTNETARVSDLKTKSFFIDGGYIYCNSEGKLFKIPVAGGPECPLQILGSINNEFVVQVLNGTFYYVSSLNNGLYKVGAAQSLNPGAKVTGMKIENGYFVCTFQKEAGNPYSTMIVDKDGKIVFKTSDDIAINRITIEKGQLSYVKNTGNTIYKMNLPK